MHDKVANYYEFLAGKIDAVDTNGVSLDAASLHPSTFPHQADSIRWALRNGRALLAMSFGLGKTHIQIELARLIVQATGQPFLIVCPLGVKHQFITEDGPRLGVKWQYVRTDAEVSAALVAGQYFLITNYERVRDSDIDPKLHDFAGVSLDEGSVMRSLGSKTYGIFMSAFADVPYRYVCTATPSPNQFRELIYYAEFLGVMDHGQALTRWFKRDPEQAGNLQLHPAHERDFWLWVATWALFLFTPSDLGYDDAGYAMPELRVHWHRLPVDQTRAWDLSDNRGQGLLLLDTTLSATAAAQEKRATLDARVQQALDVIAAKDPREHWLIWHHLEDERKAIEKALPEAKTVYGTLAMDEKERRVLGFTHGEIRILASKPELSGFGCNFQYHCHANVFLGIDYKFEDFIQSIHRTYRFQQSEPVDVHIIYSESEDKVADTLRQKWQRHNDLTEKMREIVREYGLSRYAIQEALRRKLGVERREHVGQLFTAVRNDCVVELLSERIPDNSVGLIHTSIPFGNHYEYTTQFEDFGHNPSDADFWQQMDWLLPELLRVLSPGRIAAIHVKDRILYSHQTASGFMEVSPFSDECVMAFRKHGFLYEGRRTITTDVVRENNSTYRLGWSEMCHDASKMGSGLPEYLLLFRKPPSSAGTIRADIPVTKSKAEYSVARWQVDAHSYWRSDGQALQFGQLPGYDYEAHVGRLEALEENGNLPKHYFHEPPASNSDWVWDDVTFMLCLNAMQNRRKSENHICPLPLDIVRRTIRLYSNPGDVVLDPFAGLFTVPYVAMEQGRYGYGIELSEQYFEDGLYYCQQIEVKQTSPSLFDVLENAA